MRRSKNILIAAAACALTLTAFGAPVAGETGALIGEPKVYAVNGLPGVRVDVCVNGAEAKSRLRYGRFVSLETNGEAGHKFVFKRARAGDCTGQTVAKMKTELIGGSDITIVLTVVKGGPGLRVFDNALNPVLLSPGSVTPTETIHHAAKAGKVDVYASTQVQPIASPPPSWHALRRGTSAVLPTNGSGVSQMWLTRKDRQKPIAGPTYRVLEPNHNVTVFVGKSPKNYKLVKFVTGRL